MAALISSVMDTKDKVPFFVAQAEGMGIEILPPDVNLSDHEFVVVEGNIRFGLDAVKGVGFAAVEAIKAAREEGGPFESLWDFCARVDPRAVNKSAIEALIKCGAFGSTGASRKGMLGVLEQAQAAGQKAQLDAEIGQGSIFDLGDAGGGAAARASPFVAPRTRRSRPRSSTRPSCWRSRRRRSGCSSPRTRSRRCARRCAPRSTRRWPTLPERKDGDWVTVGGIITQAKKIRTKKGDPMMFATLDDLEGSIEVMIFGKALAEYEGALGVDEVVTVRGRVDHGDKGTSLDRADGRAFGPTRRGGRGGARGGRASPRARRPLTVRLDATALPATIIEELKHVLGNHAGRVASSCWRSRPRSARARCASATATAPGPRACAPSSPGSSVRPRLTSAETG